MGNYLTREMAFRVARKHIVVFGWVELALGAIVPVVLLLVSLVVGTGLAGMLQVVATLSLLAGIFMERWLFFAVAKHAVGLYYGGEDRLVPAA